MDPNPYHPSTSRPDTNRRERVCERRLDIILIAAFFGCVGVLSFAVLAVPTLRDWTMPRFGQAGTLTLFPLNFLCLYLWKPAPRLLALSSAMFLFVALILTAQLAWFGTVSMVSHPFHERLHTSYAWTVAPLVVASIYVGAVAWRTRFHVAMQGDSTHEHYTP